MVNTILPDENDVATRIAQRTLAKREPGYASEVRRLLDAALEVMRQGGTASRPRVADIVAAAGLPNDADLRRHLVVALEPRQARAPRASPGHDTIAW